MKQLLKFIIPLALLVASCAPDKDNDPNSPSPETDARDKYAAQWHVTENSAVAGTNTHNVTISKSTTNSTEVLISNFSGLSVSARASVNNNVLTIPYQQLGSLGFTQGSGTLTSSSNINLTYTTTISSNRDSCTATYTKQ